MWAVGWGEGGDSCNVQLYQDRTRILVPIRHPWTCVLMLLICAAAGTHVPGSPDGQLDRQGGQQDSMELFAAWVCVGVWAGGGGGEDVQRMGPGGGVWCVCRWWQAQQRDVWWEGGGRLLGRASRAVSEGCERPWVAQQVVCSCITPKHSHFIICPSGISGHSCPRSVDSPLLARMCWGGLVGSWRRAFACLCHACAAGTTPLVMLLGAANWCVPPAVRAMG